jgi:ornithine carbamoyltransferase
MDVTVVCPDLPQYSPDPEMLSRAKSHTGKEAQVSHVPSEGVVDADVIYTDTWVSAGVEEEKKKRMEVFPPYQVNMELVKRATIKKSKEKGNSSKQPIVMHCLPAYRDYEITSEVMDSSYSVVFDQAENRMWAQMGLLLWLQHQI